MNFTFLSIAPWLVGGLLFLAILFFFVAFREKNKAGLPGGKIVYSDMNLWEKVEIPLYHPMLKLSGRPDYIVRQKHEHIPVEVKTGRTPKAPYDSHIFQLAAYCLLVENEYRVRPSFGIIHYPEKNFQIDFTYELEAAILVLINEMHKEMDNEEIHCSHSEPQRCHGCGFRQVCEESLV